MATIGNSQILVTEARIDQLKRRMASCYDPGTMNLLTRELKEAQERLDCKRKALAERVN